MIPEQSYREIILTNGMVTLVDTRDFEFLNQWHWYALWNERSKRWAVQRCASSSGVRQSVYMHRVIMGLERGDPLHVDHINHNPLDNRRANLRIATRSQNSANSRTNTRNICGLKGVETRLCGSRFIYRASVVANKIRHRSRWLATPEEAHAAYCEMAKQLHGEFFFSSIEDR